jgi:hypothetical protein
MWVAAFLLLVIVGGLSEARHGRSGRGIRIWVLDCSLRPHGTGNLLARAN